MSHIHLKSPRETELMRRAGQALAGMFAELFDMIVPGTATIDIDRTADAAIRRVGAEPAFKGYGDPERPFPATTCISIDREIVHGMPSKRKLQQGQIVGIDVGLKWNGYYADMAASFLVGDVDNEVRRLWRVTREALYKGIEQARPGNRINDISGAVQDWAERHNYSVIRDLTGHGIGSNLHEDPPVMNYRSRKGNTKLMAGMTLAIEPMIAMGGYRIKVLSDGWTAVTADGSSSAHFEHTILVTDGEPEILTRLEDGRDPWKVAAERGRKIG